MMKVAKLVNAEHQVCFAHGIHSYVCDLQYKKIPANELTSNVIDGYDDDNEELDSGLVIETGNGRDLTNDQNINEVVKQGREVVLIFKDMTHKCRSDLHLQLVKLIYH